MNFNPQHRIIELMTKNDKQYRPKRYLFVDYIGGWDGQFWTNDKAAAAPFTHDRAKTMKDLLKRLKGQHSHIRAVRTRAHHIAGAGNMVGGER